MTTKLRDRKALGLNIQAKLIIAIVLAALSVATPLFVYNQWVLRNALVADAEEFLLAAAGRTASRLDGFSSDTMHDLAAQAQQSMLAEYLAELRDGGHSESSRLRALEALRAFQGKREVFLTSYALLDSKGRNVLDTVPQYIGSDESGYEHFRSVMSIAFGRRPFQSPVHFTRGRGYIHFSARVSSPAGELLGVLRARCSLAMVSHLALLDEGFAGPGSYAVVIDEHGLVLAQGTKATRGVAGKFATLPGPELLRDAYGLALPVQGTMDLAWRDFIAPMERAERELARSFDGSFPSAPDRTIHAAMTTTESQRWRVVFIKPAESFLAPMRQHTRNAVLVLAVCVVLVALLGWFLGWLLARPIASLKDSATRLAEGDLQVRAAIDSRDEIGSLAQTFNYMAERLAVRIRSEAAVATISGRFLSMAIDGDLDQRIIESLATVAEVTGANRAYVYWPGRDSDAMVQWHDGDTAPLPSSEADLGDLQEMMQRTDGAGQVAIDEVSAVADDCRAGLAPWIASGARSVLCVAMRSQGTFRGLVGCDLVATGRAWTKADQHIMRIVGELVWAAHERHAAHQARLDAEAALQEANEKLEARVLQRTRELSETNAHLESEMRAREALRRERDRVARQLVQAARRAGMAEIAANVLHNVGNVATSVRVSVRTLHEALNDSWMRRLPAVAALIREHGDHLGDYMRDDPRGQRLPEYICRLCDAVEEDRGRMLLDVENLEQTTEHMVKIITAQRSMAGDSRFTTEEDCAEVVTSAVRFHQARIDDLDIALRCDLEDGPPVVIDKHKVLQILDNLIDNACAAITAARVARSDDVSDTLHITLTRSDDMLRIAIRDSGSGIRPDLQAKIFSRGYTTKADGSGLGLHMSAMAAREMNGRLTVHSDGPGTGATFTLELPWDLSRITPVHPGI